MKRSIAVLGAVSLFALAAAAQDVPKVELFTGFTYTRVNSASNIPAFSANGGGGQFVVNIGKTFRLCDRYRGGSQRQHRRLSPRHDADELHVRPAHSDPRVHRVTPYFQALFGGVYGSTSCTVTVPPGTVVLPPVVTPVNSTAAATTRPTRRTPLGSARPAPETAFAMAFGGGLDIRINKAP